MLARIRLSMWNDHHTMLKKSEWPKPGFRAPIWGLGAPKNGPKMNFFVCSFRTVKFSGLSIVGCRTSLIQKFFSYGAIVGLLRGPQKSQFMWKTSLLILAVALLRSLIDSSMLYKIISTDICQLWGHYRATKGTQEVSIYVKYEFANLSSSAP